MTRSVVQLGGQALKLDADGDTTIQVSSDDVLIVDTAGNEALKIDANGYVTKPLQCSFHVTKDSAGGGHQLNISNSGYDTITFSTEIRDTGGNFASNTFTAPVTGIYHLHMRLRIENVDTAPTYYNSGIQTSNRYHANLMRMEYASSDPQLTVFEINAIADMDANDTAFCNIFQNGGTSQTDLSAYYCAFYGHLLG